ncbi:MAG: hypothetical protein IK020_00165 [Clostridiales bacterium]|nr:hypothetical protein [Clostridiales bacterium]
MDCHEIIVCDDVKCIYSEDAGGYEGEIDWLDGKRIRLFLACDPEAAGEPVVMKFFFEQIYREREKWTKKAVKFACDRFIPYYLNKAGFAEKCVLKRSVLKAFLVPETLELQDDGLMHISFKCFSFGKTMHFLDVAGTVASGFVRLQDNGEDIPEV